jgi:hypothetical protein
MLDLNNGGLRIKDVVLRPRLTKDEFVRTELYPDVLREDQYGYTRYSLRPQDLLGERWSVFLYFNPDQMLEMVSLSMLEDEKMSSWEHWSEEKELEKKAKHDAFLVQYLGKPPYKYKWGEVSSQYDPRSGSSDVTIQYS